MNQATRLKPLFHPGRLLVAPAALAALRANGVPVISIMLRHIAGDWGVISDDDKKQNDLSVATGLRLISLYHLPDGTRIIVTTEWDRSSTTIEKIDAVATSRAARSPSTPNGERPERPGVRRVAGSPRMNAPNGNGPRFPIGRPVITPAAQAALDAAGISGVPLLARHVHGDWGEVSIEDFVANDLALLAGRRVLSIYALPNGETVWVITEADRSVTTILLPDDY